MITAHSTNVNLMTMKAEDVLMRLNSMLTYVKTMNEHAVNTSCSEDKIKEVISNFFNERIQELEKNIQFVKSVRDGIVE
jgi:redox-regulated HSP33 family molecular chaperone